MVSATVNKVKLMCCIRKIHVCLFLNFMLVIKYIHYFMYSNYSRHTYTDGTGVTEGWIPDSLKDDVVQSFQSNFLSTQVQVRYPWETAIQAGFGLHDDSFAHATLDGEYNGGENVGWFFWPAVES